MGTPGPTSSTSWRSHGRLHDGEVSDQGGSRQRGCDDHVFLFGDDHIFEILGVWKALKGTHLDQNQKTNWHTDICKLEKSVLFRGFAVFWRVRGLQFGTSFLSSFFQSAEIFGKVTFLLVKAMIFTGHLNQRQWRWVFLLAFWGQLHAPKTFFFSTEEVWNLGAFCSRNAQALRVHCQAVLLGQAFFKRTDGLSKMRALRSTSKKDKRSICCRIC